MNLPDLAHENTELREKLREAEELIAAIRTGAIDALAVQSSDGPRIFTLEGADQGYRTLIEQMNEGAMLLSPNATILYCNIGLANLLDCRLEELLGTSIAPFVPEEFTEYWELLVAKGWAGKAKGELPLLTPSSRLRPFAVSMNVLSFNGTLALAVLVTDLSAQGSIKAIQALVAEQNTMLELKDEELAHQQAARLVVEKAITEANRLLEGIPQIAWTARPNGVNTYLNQRWFDYTGQDNTWPMEDKLLASIHPDDLPAALASWGKSLPTGKPVELECRILGHDGQYRWMLGRALPSRNAQGEIIQWVGTYTDIHEQKLALQHLDEAQSELQHNNEQLTRVNVDLDNFIYTASHDLKAPIVNIEGLLQALQTELPPDPSNGADVQLLLNMMQDSVDRFKQTIELLTDVSRLQKSYLPASERVDVGTVVQEVRLDLEPLIHTLAARIEVDVSGCPVVLFSKKNLRSVVYNLLSNALKYHHAERPPFVRIECRAEDGYDVFQVQDNGLGLDLANADKLFGMFQRLHDHVEGSGIGLYMIKKMVENVGGRIEVQSEVGIGSIFSVYLPQQQALATNAS